VRIALITSGLRGPASYIINLTRGLKKRNHDVLIVSSTKWVKEKIENLYVAKSWLALGLAPVVFGMRALIGVIESFKPDVIHCHWPTGTPDWRFGKILRTGIPAVATIHVSVDSRDFLWDTVFYKHFGIFIPYMKSLSSVISISDFVKKQVDRRVQLTGVPHNLVYTGVDEVVFYPAPREEDDTLKLLYVGQVMPEKGIDVLVEAFLKVREKRKTTLTIIGEGHLKGILERKTRDLECVRWIGFVGSQSEIAEQYARADLTVLATRWDEAFSLVPVESLACGTPVLSTRKGGNPEIVIPQKSGFLIDNCDRDAIADVLLSVRLEELRGMRAGCRALALEKFSLGRWLDAHEKIYTNAVSRMTAR
jgi:glycosyltransferase involved in cell wall biosynthesis